MAKGKQAKNPRIRKTAPTLREKIEEAQAKADKPTPAKKTRLPKVNRGKKVFNNQIAKKAGKTLSPIGKALRWLAPRYFINSWRELRQVVWPSRKETWRLTLAVFIFAIIFGALVAGVDKGLDEIFKHLVLK